MRRRKTQTIRQTEIQIDKHRDKDGDGGGNRVRGINGILNTIFGLPYDRKERGGADQRKEGGG